MLAYLFDKKYDYVKRINNKLKLGNNLSVLFYIGIMTFLIYIIGYLSLKKFDLPLIIPYLLTSIVVEICIYSATNYKELEKNKN